MKKKITFNLKQLVAFLLLLMLLAAVIWIWVVPLPDGSYFGESPSVEYSNHAKLRELSAFLGGLTFFGGMIAFFAVGPNPKFTMNLGRKPKLPKATVKK